MKVTKHQNTSVLPILQSGQGFVWTPEGLKAEELATWEDVPEDIKQLAKDINDREYEEHRRNNDVRFTGEKALEPEDWKFAAALAGGIGTAQAASTMGWVPAITTDVASGIGGTTVGYGSNWVGQKIDNKFGTNVTPWLTVVGSLIGGAGGYRAGYKGAVKGAKYAVDNGIRGYSDFKPAIQEQILPTPQATQEPILNVGWAPKQTTGVRRAGDLTEMYYPGRWDVVEEGANPFGVWLQGKFGIPRTDITNPGKGAKAKRARELFAERPQYSGQVTLDKPIQTVGEVPNRSALSYDAERMGADGIIYNNVYDNGYNNNQVVFSFKRPELDKGYKFFERPSKLTDAEKMGIPKGERNQPVKIKSKEEINVNNFLQNELRQEDIPLRLKIDHINYYGNPEKIKEFNRTLNDYISTLPNEIDSRFAPFQTDYGGLRPSIATEGYRRYLDELGLDASDVSDEDLAKLLTSYHKTLQSETTGKLKNVVAWHSSPNNFEEFNFQKNLGLNTGNTGEIGPGNYFSITAAPYGFKGGKPNMQPYIITDVLSTPSGKIMQEKGLLPDIQILRGNPNREQIVQKMIDDIPQKDNRAYINTNAAFDGFYVPSKIDGEIMLRRNTGIKSLYPHPSRFVRNEDGTVSLLPSNWDDPRVNFKQGGQLPKLQPGGLISSPEEAEQYRYERAVNNANRYAQRKPLEELNNSKLGKTLDYVDLGADVVSMTGIPYVSQAAGAVGTITGMPQAIAGGKEWLLDMSREGLKFPTLDQGVAMAKLIPTGGLFDKAGMKALLTKTGPIKGLKWRKILSRWIPNAINLGSDTYEIIKNKQGGTLPYYLKYFNYDTTKEK